MEEEFYLQHDIANENVAAEEIIISSEESSTVVRTPVLMPKFRSSDATTEYAMESMFSAWKFCHQPDAINFYTGLESYEKFVFVRQTLGPAQDKLMCFHGLRPSLSVKVIFV